MLAIRPIGKEGSNYDFSLFHPAIRPKNFLEYFLTLLYILVQSQDQVRIRAIG